MQIEEIILVTLMMNTAGMTKTMVLIETIEPVTIVKIMTMKITELVMKLMEVVKTMEMVKTVRKMQTKIAITQPWKCWKH